MKKKIGSGWGCVPATPGSTTDGPKNSSFDVNILSSKLSPHCVQDWQSYSFECHILCSYIRLVPILHLGGVRL